MTAKTSGLRFLAILGLLAATAAVYAQVSGHDFLSYDDREYVSNNEHVKGGLTLDGVRWAFSTGEMGNWHPLTWLSLMLNCQLAGTRAGPVLIGNLILHLANVLLLFLAFERATRETGKSLFVAGLFALHPLHVESVAWVSERKDVLSGLFWMLTMLFYVRYAEAPAPRRLVPALVCFGLGLMAKPMLVTLPFVLLLLDVWPLGRTAWPLGGAGRSVARTELPGRHAAAPRPAGAGRGPAPPPDLAPEQASARDRASLPRPASAAAASVPRTPWRALVLEKTPFFALAAVSSVVAFITQRGVGVVVSTDVLPLTTRIGNALVSYVAYLAKTAAPVRLAVIYPHPGMPPLWQVMGSAVLLAAVTVLVLREAPRSPFLAVGWLWYLGTLVPVIGLVQIGAQALADRYTYLPLIGVFLILAWGIPGLVPASARRGPALAAGAVAALAACAFATWHQTAYWTNSNTLFRRTLEVTENNYIAHNNLGTALDAQGRSEEAISHLEEALRLKPDHPMVNNNLANALAKRGRLEEAIRHYEKAIAVKPDSAEAHYNLANALVQTGRSGEVLPHLEAAVRAKPGFTAARYNLGGALLLVGRSGEAARQFAEVIRLDPGYAGAHRSLGYALVKEGRTVEAVEQLELAIRTEPDFPEAYNDLARIRAAHADERFRNGAEAVRLAERACQLTSRTRAAYLETLGMAYAEAGRMGDAGSTARDALALAASQGSASLANRLREEIASYEAGRPWREAAGT